MPIGILAIIAITLIVNVKQKTLSRKDIEEIIKAIMPKQAAEKTITKIDVILRLFVEEK